MSATFGKWVWITRDGVPYIAAEVMNSLPTGGHLMKSVDGKEYECKEGDYEEMHNTSVDGVADMITLNDLHESSLLHNLQIRHKNCEIYTFTGTILVAVNPYQYLPLYTPDVQKSYMNARFGEMPPHLYAIADDAYRVMREYGKNQSIIISGESGAGKTESTKLILQYLAQVSTKKSWVEQQILESSPVLEAFGNAKTVRNNNSSRFGKFINIAFDREGAIFSARMEQYLLEKSRIVHQAPNERNYHIFYQLVTGSSDEEKALYELKPLESYHYLNQSGCLKVENIDDNDDFEQVKLALEVLGFTADEQTALFRIVSAVLHCGNYKFADEGGKVTLANPEAAECVARLLSLDAEKLKKAAVERENVIRGEVFYVPYSKNEAEKARDAFAKAVYGRMFVWLVDRINKSIADSAKANAAAGGDMARMTHIGVLDIFGFEKFEVNSFEQLCINYANEKLQQHFNQHIFKLEQLEYGAEGIDWEKLDFTDNQETLDVIEKKPIGLLALLDEECRMPKATDGTFVEKCHDRLNASKFYVKPKLGFQSKFGILHYAGEVMYEVSGFLDKNSDRLQDNSQHVLEQSGNTLVGLLFAPEAPVQSASGGAVKKSGQKTVGSQFKESLIKLMAVLNSTQPYFIRCIKPNTTKSQVDYDRDLVLRQLRYSGMLETIRIRRQGYPIRRPFDDFLFRYRALLTSELKAKASQMAKPELIMSLMVDVFSEQANAADYAMGKSKFFMRDNVSQLLETHRRPAIKAVACQIQNRLRGYVQRCAYLRDRQRVVKIQATYRMWLSRKSYLARIHAAISLQRFVRGFLCRFRYQRQRSAALCIQGVVKTRQQRKRYLRLLHDAIVMQTLIRRYLARAQYQLARRRVIQIQSVIRMFLVRKAQIRIKKAISLFQAIVKRRQQQKRYQTLRSATILFQKNIRRHQATKHYGSTLKKIVLVQSIVRRWLGKRVLLRLQGYSLKSEAQIKAEEAALEEERRLWREEQEKIEAQQREENKKKLEEQQARNRLLKKRREERLAQHAEELLMLQEQEEELNALLAEEEEIARLEEAKLKAELKKAQLEEAARRRETEKRKQSYMRAQAAERRAKQAEEARRKRVEAMSADLIQKELDILTASSAQYGQEIFDTMVVVERANKEEDNDNANANATTTAEDGAPVATGTDCGATEAATTLQYEEVEEEDVGQEEEAMLVNAVDTMSLVDETQKKKIAEELASAPGTPVAGEDAAAKEKPQEAEDLQPREEERRKREEEERAHKEKERKQKEAQLRSAVRTAQSRTLLESSRQLALLHARIIDSEKTGLSAEEDYRSLDLLGWLKAHVNRKNVAAVKGNVKFSNAPMMTSLLSHSTEQMTKIAVEVFSSILKYGGHFPYNNKKEQPLSFVRTIVSRGLNNVGLRNEIYVQLIKQTTQSPAEGAKKYWELFALVTGCFLPESDDLARIAMGHCQRTGDQKPSATLPAEALALAQQCVTRMVRTHTNGPRGQAPGAMEIASLLVNRPVIIRVTMVDGASKALKVDHATTAAEVVTAMTRMLELKYTVGFGLFVAFDKAEFALKPETHILDQFVRTKGHQQQSSTTAAVSFSFKKMFYVAEDERSVDPAATYFLYHEALSRFRQGYFGCEDYPTSATLAVLAYLISRDMPEQLNVKLTFAAKNAENWMEYIPTLIKGKMSTDKWSKLLVSVAPKYLSLGVVNARQNFLDIARKYPLSSSIIYAAADKGKDISIAVHLQALYIIKEPERQVVLSQPMHTIGGVSFTPESFMLTIKGGSKLRYSTSDGAAICSLIASYMEIIRLESRVCVALETVEGEAEHELLPIQQGQIITILARDDKGWFKGHVQGAPTPVGWFPGDSVQVLIGPPETTAKLALEEHLAAKKSGKAADPLPPPPALPATATDAADVDSVRIYTIAAANFKFGDLQSPWDLRPHSEYVQMFGTEHAKPDLKFTRIPIKGSLLPMKKSGSTEEAVSIFLRIMAYMRDYRVDAAVTPQQLLTAIARAAMARKELKNEVYMQIVKQVTEHPRKEGELKGWEMLVVLSGVVLPSKEYLPHLGHYLLEARKAKGPVGMMADRVFRRLVRASTAPRRRAPPLPCEVKALRSLTPLTITIRTLASQKVELPIDSSTTGAEIRAAAVKRLKLGRGGAGFVCMASYKTQLPGATGLEETECVVGNSAPVCDILARDMNKAGDSNVVFTLVKRYYSASDCQADAKADSATTVLMYYQAVHQFLRGELLPTDDSNAYTLAALSLRASGPEMSEDELMQHLAGDLTRLPLPDHVRKAVKNEDDIVSLLGAAYIKNVQGKMATEEDAMTAFLSLARKQRLYGSTFFYCENKRMKNWPATLVLCVSPSALAILNPQTHEIADTIDYKQTSAFKGTSTTFNMMLMPATGGKPEPVLLDTPDGEEIVALLTEITK